MTEKDYELIARAFSAYADSDRALQDRLQSIARLMSNLLKQDNPRFNKETFLKSFGL